MSSSRCLLIRTNVEEVQYLQKCKIHQSSSMPNNKKKLSECTESLKSNLHQLFRENARSFNVFAVSGGCLQSLNDNNLITLCAISTIMIL